MKHEIRITKKKSLFGVWLWEVIKITHFRSSQRLESIYQGTSFKNAVKVAKNARGHVNESSATIIF